MSELFSITRHTIRSTAAGFSNDELMTRAAALAFYSALSLAPLLVLLIWVLSLHSGWERQFLGTLQGMAGPRAADAVSAVVESAKARPHTGKLAGLVGVLVTLLGASAIFVQLQTALNRIWNVRPKPGAAMGTWLRARARALALLLGILFLLIISFAISALIQLLVPGNTLAWQIVENLISAAVFIGLFGAMYKVLPDVIIGWSEALSGGSLTAVLFIIGKFLIGLYMQHSNVGGAYGPAGAIIVLLTWIYYSAIIVLLGAELTHGLAAARGAPLRPSAHAVEMEAALTEKEPA